MQTYSHSEKLMGSSFTLAVVAESSIKAQDWLQIGVSYIRDMELEMSEFLPASTTSLLANNAGKSPIQVSSRFFALVERSIHISKLTQDAFDITMGPLKGLYSFKQGVAKIPDEANVLAMMHLIGSKFIDLNRDKQSILLKKKGMAISFAGIAKGTAADGLKNHWQELGVKSGYINASGDISAFGNKPDGKPWLASISNPSDKEKALFAIPLNDRCIATSGDYVQYFIGETGRKYSHTLDPRTGYPVEHMQSVTVISPSAELSDALATAASVLKPREAIALINQLPQCYVILIDDGGQILFSKEMEYFQITA